MLRTVLSICKLQRYHALLEVESYTCLAAIFFFSRKSLMKENLAISFHKQISTQIYNSQ
jgi:hypothetical protein